jgi:predicted component of type VI protein secretion system
MNIKHILPLAAAAALLAGCSAHVRYFEPGRQLDLDVKPAASPVDDQTQRGILPRLTNERPADAY